MSDLYLNFADEAEAISVLPEFRVEDEDGNMVWNTHTTDAELDVIGPIWIDDVLQTGWHVNIRGLEKPEWSAYLVYPAQPVRGWA